MYMRKQRYKSIVLILAIIALIVVITLMLKYIANSRSKSEATGGEEATSLAEKTEKLNNNQIQIVSENNNGQVQEQNAQLETKIEKQNETEQNIIEQTSNEQKSVEQPLKEENKEEKSITETTSEVDTTSTASKITKIEDANKTVNTERKGVIYLTFDDGPSSNITPKILDLLKKEGIKATFFVINYSDENEALIKREVEEGHTIGIHGYSHEYSKIYKSKETYMNNVYSLQEKIKKSTGVTTTYTRFPGGSSNTVSRKYSKGIMTQLANELLSKGFTYYDWNVCAEDAGSAKSAKDVYNYTVKGLKKDRQNMVLMHDFTGNQKGLDALPDIIKYGKDNGYKFMAIDDQTPLFAQHINN